MRNMAAKASSKKSPAPSRTSLYRPHREQIESAEVRRSRKAALLQLSMGRVAHIIGIASGLALALTAVIAYGLIHWDFLRVAPDGDAPAFLVTLKWVIPLVAGIIAAGVAIIMKWDPYVADREEPHFVMSVIALVVPIMLIVLIVLDEYGQVALGRPAWLYPASLLGICLAEVSLAMTWEGTGSRKMTSIVAAIFPVALLLFPIFYKFSDTELASILPMAYLGSAVAIQLSGSMLHIISSSTQVQQREVLKASDSKLKEQILEIDKKRQAMVYREEALRSKESGLEAYEKRLSDEMSSLEERKQQVIAAETDLENRVERVIEERERLSKREGELEAREDVVEIKLTEAEGLRRDMDNRLKALLAREQTISAREHESSKSIIDLQAKERDLKGRISELQAEQTSLEAVRSELSQFEEALLDREKQIAARESDMEMRSIELQSARQQLGTVEAEKTTVITLEQQLKAKHEQLREREAALKTLDDDIKQKSEKAERLISRADKQMNELVEKESVVMAKEKSLADKEAELRREIQNISSQLEEMASAKAQVVDLSKQYHTMSETTRGKLSTISVKEDEISRKMAALEKREEKIKELEGRLRGEHDNMDTKLRQLLEKEKALEAEEAEVNLKQAELREMEREMLESVDEFEEAKAGLPTVEVDERESVYEFRERRLAEKEQEMKASMYQHEKELEKRELALKAHLTKDLQEMEEEVQEEYAEQKVKTGIERLDDLLMGGMPFGASVLYIGPPFIGKEVAMLLFLAEGLKKGVPAIVVTTSRSSSEISKDIAPILPTFKEFEQLGLVRWIDASGLPFDQQAEPYAKVLSVSKPGDLKGISEAVERTVKELQKQKHPYFRFAYFSLSMSMTQADEKSSYQFVASLAGRLKGAGGVSVFAIERGMHTEQQLESIQHHMSGAIQFKTDKQKTLLSVQGIGDAQTRDWIEYRHTNKALMVGAFSLERIR